MAVFAQRIGVSEQTVRAMERGLPTVQIGTWLAALWALDELEPLDRLLEKRGVRRPDGTSRFAGELGTTGMQTII
jgi:hypothetical protein